MDDNALYAMHGETWRSAAQWLSQWDWYTPLYYTIAAVFAIISLFLIRQALCSAAGKTNGSGAIAASVGLCLLLMGRLPFLFMPESNVDESLSLAASLTIKHGGFWWSDADPTTLGPVNQMLLLITAFFTGSVSYFSARITALILSAGGVLLLWRAAVRLAGKQSVLPPLAVLMVTLFYAAPYFDIQAFNCETTLFFTACLWLYSYARFRISARGELSEATQGRAFAEVIRVDRWSILCAVLAGVLPFIKLQYALLAVMLIIILIYQILLLGGGKRPFFMKAAALFLCAALPLMLVVLSSALFGSVTWFWRFYVENAFAHVRYSLGYFLSHAWQVLSVITHASPSLIAPYLLLVVLAGTVLSYFGKANAARQTVITGDESKATVRSRGAVALLLLQLAVVLYTVLRPLSSFLHYSSCLLSFELIAMFWYVAQFNISKPTGPDRVIEDKVIEPRAERSILTLTVGFALAMLLYVAETLPSTQWRHSLDNVQDVMAKGERNALWSAVAKYINERKRPGDSIVVWGWLPRFFLYTDLPSATAQLNIERVVALEDRAYPQFNQDKYLHDIDRKHPRFIIDAVCPACFGYTDEKYRLDQSKFMSAVMQDYFLNAEIRQDDSEIRIYERR